MSEIDALIFANEAFYRAFADKDIHGLNAIWAEDKSVSCIHPGWNALDDREDIMQSFAQIIGGPAPPQIECHAPKATIHGDTGIVICYEAIGGEVLVATNIFVRGGSTWQMVHHHAGPASSLPLDPEESDPVSIN